MGFWDNAQATQYIDSQNSNDFSFESGIFILPVAEEPPTNSSELAAWTPVATIKAHAPYRIRKMNFHFTKSSAPPAIPTPQSTGAFTFVGGDVSFAQPRLNLSLNNYDWEVGGSYLFVENCRSDPQDGFVLGNAPFATVIQQENASTVPAGNPQLGAIAQAGSDARIGYTQGASITENGNWIYSTPSYFPSQLLNSDMINGASTSYSSFWPVAFSLVTGGINGAFEAVNPQTQVITAPDSGTATDPFGDSSPF